jgi:hypothetical protein
MEYTIDENKLQKTTRAFNDIAYPYYATNEEIENFILADWHEGKGHQQWLDSVDAQEIADWVAACILG